MNKDTLFKKFSERYRNPSKSYERKLKRFDVYYDRAENIAKYLYSKQKNKSLDDIKEDLLQEFYSFKGSILKSFRNLKSRTFEENEERAKQLRVKHRLKEFLSKWGNNEFSYGGIKKTLSGWVNSFLDNRISNKELYDIIKDYQKQNPDYDPSQYSHKNSESSSAILNEVLQGNFL